MKSGPSSVLDQNRTVSRLNVKGESATATCWVISQQLILRHVEKHSAAISRCPEEVVVMTEDMETGRAAHGSESGSKDLTSDLR